MDGRLIRVCGLPGTGRTTVARRLAGQPGTAYLLTAGAGTAGSPAGGSGAAWARSIVERSVICRKSTAAMTPTTAMPAEIAKMWPVASPYAARMMSWTCGGSWARLRLLVPQLNTFAAVERELAAEVTARTTEPDPSGVRARLTAATFMAALRVALHIWLDAPAGASLDDLVARALAEAGRGFA